MIKEKCTANPRREFLRRAVDFAQLKGLEIGALNEPLVKKEDIRAGGRIFYLDHLPTEGLCEKYGSDPSVNVDNIVPVDFVCRDGNIVEATAGNMFDYVVASHVIEHTPNFLQFLIDIHKILKPGGHLILIIPDKRFTFDVNRPITTFGEVLETFFDKQKIPSISAVYDHFAMASKVSGHDTWHGIANPEETNLLVSEAFAWDAACRVHNEAYYYDVHVNIFTPQSFFEILKKMIAHDIVLFETKEFLDTQIGQIEFLVQLQKPENEPSKGQKARCTKSLPKFKLESLLSPYMPQVKALTESIEALTKHLNKSEEELRDMREQIAVALDKKEKLEKELSVAQSMLDRRSVKIILALIHKFMLRR